MAVAAGGGATLFAKFNNCVVKLETVKKMRQWQRGDVRDIDDYYNGACPKKLKQ